MAQKLQTLLNPTNSNVAIEPLTLANPVSEVLKVCPFCLTVRVRRPTSCVLQILVNFLQVTSVALAINVDWEDSLRRTLYAMGMFLNMKIGHLSWA